MAVEIESSVQMRLYALNKRQFVMVFIMFFFAFGICVLIGIAGPPIVDTVVQNASTVQPQHPDLKTNFKNLIFLVAHQMIAGIIHNFIEDGVFHLKSPPMSTFHQQFWLIAHIVTDNKGGAKFEQPFTVSVLIRGMKGEDQSIAMSDNPELNGDIHNRSRLLRCSKECDDLILLHLGYLDFSNYMITIKFYGLGQSKFNIDNIIFYFKSYNTAFTQIEIWIRFVFLVMAFFATCLFAHTLRKFSMRDWSIEQKWMSVLLPLLLLYNDPIFPLTFLVDSWIPGMFDGIFQATFLCGLLLFWLCIYHGVRQTNRRFGSFYLPKVIVVGLIWITAVTLASWQEYNELQDPTYYYRLDTSNFIGFKIFFFVVGGLYLLYLLYLLVRAYAELRSMPYFDLRLKFMTVLMLIVLSISVTITFLRFGGAALQDNFVAELATHYQNSAEFVSFYALLNLYMYTMAFVYSPSKNALFETHFKDNPALSMLNDSDEEVHYGSDNEDTVLRNKGSRYDSDDETFHH